MFRENTERRVIMAFDMPAVIRVIGPDTQSLVPDEQCRVDDDKSHNAHRKEHQSKNIHEQKLKTIMRSKVVMMRLSFTKSP